MQKLINRVDEMGVAQDKLKVHGILHLVPARLNTALIAIYEEAKREKEASGKDASDYESIIERERSDILNKYVPAFKMLRIMDGDKTILELSYDAEPELLEEIASDMQMALERFPMWDVKVAEGAAPPERSVEFSGEWLRIKETCLADKEAMSLIGTDDRKAFDQALFRKFKQRDAYLKNPCEIEFFLALSKERLDLNYTSMQMTDYYNWYHRSQAMLDQEGCLKSETRTEAIKLLTAWKTLPPEEQKYWLCRNMSVHPRHRDVFKELVDEFQAEILPTLD